MITALFLDFYGTLARFYPPREEVQTQAISAFGYTVTREGLVKGYALADAYMAQVNASNRPMSRLRGEDRLQFFAEYERRILSGAGLDVDAGTARRIWECVQQIPYDLALYEETLPVLDMVRQQHEVTIGMISNIGRNIQELVRSLGLAPYLHFTVTSEEAGSNKPHPPIFLLALEKAGVDPSEALHVGDSYLSDVQGARNVGVNALLLDREGIAEEVDDCPKIDSLLGVLEHLGT